jgi:hypothetical protein
MTIVLRSSESLADLVIDGNGACTNCGGGLRRWGHARSRIVRGFDGEDRYRPPRVRCRACGITHVVLPADVLLRRRDAAVVIGRAWRSFAAGAGARRVAAGLGVPMETVRGWLRRLRARARAERTSAAGMGLDVSLRRWEARAADAGCTEEREIWRFVAHRTQGRLLYNTS